MKRYWFKPFRFWRICAAYYPVTFEGWVVSISVALSIGYVFLAHHIDSPSASDTLVSSFPGTMIILLILDLVTLRTGEYPSWWKKKAHKSRR